MMLRGLRVAFALLVMKATEPTVKKLICAAQQRMVAVMPMPTAQRLVPPLAPAIAILVLKATVSRAGVAIFATQVRAVMMQNASLKHLEASNVHAIRVFRVMESDALLCQLTALRQKTIVVAMPCARQRVPHSTSVLARMVLRMIFQKLPSVSSINM
jgi:hypothetical protein